MPPERRRRPSPLVRAAAGTGRGRADSGCGKAARNSRDPAWRSHGARSDQTRILTTRSTNGTVPYYAATTFGARCGPIGDETGHNLLDRSDLRCGGREMPGPEPLRPSLAIAGFHRGAAG